MWDEPIERTNHFIKQNYYTPWLSFAASSRPPILKQTASTISSTVSNNHATAGGSIQHGLPNETNQTDGHNQLERPHKYLFVQTKSSIAQNGAKTHRPELRPPIDESTEKNNILLQSTNISLGSCINNRNGTTKRVPTTKRRFTVIHSPSPSSTQHVVPLQLQGNILNGSIPTTNIPPWPRDYQSSKHHLGTRIRPLFEQQRRMRCKNPNPLGGCQNWLISAIIVPKRYYILEDNDQILQSRYWRKQQNGIATATTLPVENNYQIS